MPRSYTLTPDEREVVISKTAADHEWCIYITDPAALPSYLALAKKLGGRVVEHQGGTKIFLAEDSLFIGARRTLNLTPEQRAERVEQMKVRRVSPQPRKTARNQDALANR